MGVMVVSKNMMGKGGVSLTVMGTWERQLN